MCEVSLREGFVESSRQSFQDLPADVSPPHGLCKARRSGQPHRGRSGGFVQVEQEPGQVRVVQLAHRVDDGSSAGTIAAFFEEGQQQRRVGVVVPPVSKDGSGQTHDVGILTFPEQGPHPLHLAELTLTGHLCQPPQVGLPGGQCFAKGDAAKEQDEEQTCCEGHPV